MKKNFILDTNVLLHDPQALFSFGDNHVIIPIYVIEEIDQFKRDLSELGRNARQVARYLDGFRTEGALAQGVTLPTGGVLRVAFTDRELPLGMLSSTDNRILAVALDVRDLGEGASTIFITKDANLRIRADVLGLAAHDYDTERVEISDLYTGYSEALVESSVVDDLYRLGEIDIDLPGHGLHQFLILRDSHRPSHSALGKFNPSLGPNRVVSLGRAQKDGVWGVKPRNVEQCFALDLLLSDEIKLLTIVGKAGTGKTLLAIAAGLQKTLEENTYAKLLVSRPIFPLGKDIGYLPGDVEQKLNPWMQPIFDNVEFLMNVSKADKKMGRGYHELIDLGILEIEPLTYIRGRSIANQFLIVDEAQNLTPHEVKTIVTRVGEGTKIVLTGDPFQIDNPYVDSTNNGLVHVVNRFKDQKIAGHITMSKGERSPLAELAANLL